MGFKIIFDYKMSKKINLFSNLNFLIINKTLNFDEIQVWLHLESKHLARTYTKN